MKEYPRNRISWDPNETRRVLLLVANGYRCSEVANHIGRSVSAVTGLLHQLETSIIMLRHQRGLSKRDILLRKPLPKYNPERVTRPPEEDFPNLSLVAGEQPPSASAEADVGGDAAEQEAV